MLCFWVLNYKVEDIYKYLTLNVAVFHLFLCWNKFLGQNTKNFWSFEIGMKVFVI